MRVEGISNRGMRDEKIGDTRKLHVKELHNLYPPPNVIRIIKSRRVP
jgi:hypothetical protein